MRKATILLLLAGLVLLTGLVAWRGFGTIGETLAVAGWRLFWLPLYYVFPLVLGTVAWRLLLPPQRLPGFAAALHANWICNSINTVLPAAQIGGDAVKARLVHKRGIPGNSAIASVVVDKTVQALTQPVFALIGLALFAVFYNTREVIVGALVIIVLLAAGISGFYLVQRAGIFGGLARIIDRPGLWKVPESLSQDAGRTDEAVRETYRRRSRLLGSFVWRLAFRLAVVVELWLAAGFLGHPVGLVDALILESLIQVVVAGAFVVPAALGVQEGGFMLLGAAMGLSPEVALALSLARRARDLVLGIPGLVAWQIQEGRFAFARRSPVPPAAAKPDTREPDGVVR